MGKKKKHKGVSHDEYAGFKKIRKKNLRGTSAKLKNKRRRRARRNKRSAIKL